MATIKISSYILGLLCKNMQIKFINLENCYRYLYYIHFFCKIVIFFTVIMQCVYDLSSLKHSNNHLFWNQPCNTKQITNTVHYQGLRFSLNHTACTAKNIQWEQLDCNNMLKRLAIKLQVKHARSACTLTI